MFFYKMALLKLMPDGGWGVDSHTKNYDDIFWQDPKNKISKDVLEEEANNQKILHEKNQYKDLRRPNYPNIADQLDMLWHDINEGKMNNESSFYKAIKSIKDKFPKS